MDARPTEGPAEVMGREVCFNSAGDRSSHPPLLLAPPATPPRPQLRAELGHFGHGRQGGG